MISRRRARCRAEDDAPLTSGRSLLSAIKVCRLDTFVLRGAVSLRCRGAGRPRLCLRVPADEGATDGGDYIADNAADLDHQPRVDPGPESFVLEILHADRVWKTLRRSCAKPVHCHRSIVDTSLEKSPVIVGISGGSRGVQDENRPPRACGLQRDSYKGAWCRQESGRSPYSSTGGLLFRGHAVLGPFARPGGKRRLRQDARRVDEWWRPRPRSGLARLRPSRIPSRLPSVRSRQADARRASSGNPGTGRGTGTSAGS